jgi:glycerophosphoryl diester phosphodiesterase
MCHEKGVKVVPWTVNDVESMKKMKEMGTDGLITDYPNLAVNLF